MNSSWWPLIARARAGEPGPLEEVQFALGPWAHGVLLAHVSRAEAAPRATAVLEGVLESSQSAAGPRELVTRVVEAARAAAGQPPLTEDSPTETQAHRALAALRRLSSTAAERAVLRLVEGIPGPDLVEVFSTTPEAVRDDLAQAVRLALLALGVDPGPESRSTWLWSMEGAPDPQLGKLEMWLSDLRHDWSTAELSRAVVPPAAAPAKAGDPGVPLFATGPAPGDESSADSPTRHQVDLPAEGQLDAARASGARAGPDQTMVEEDDATAPVGAPLRAGQRPTPPPRPLPLQARSTPAPRQSAPRRRRTRDELPAVPPPEVTATPKLAAPLSLMDEPDPSSPAANTASLDAQRHIATTHFRPLVQRPRRLIWAGLGLLAASGVLAFVALKAVERRVTGGYTLRPVLVARVDLPEGTVLSADTLATLRVPDNFAAASQLVAPEQLSLVLNQPLLVPVQPGDPIFYNMFQYGPVKKLPILKKLRAFTVQVGDVEGVGKWVQPDDHVDILMTVSEVSSPKHGQAEPAKEPALPAVTTRTMMQKVAVLATGRPTTGLDRVKRSEKNYAHVTVMALPEEAEQLALAAKDAALYVTLRGEDDLDVLEDSQVSRCKADACTLYDGVRVDALRKRRLGLIEIIRNGDPKSR